jgi:plastocyanin
MNQIRVSTWLAVALGAVALIASACSTKVDAAKADYTPQTRTVSLTVAPLLVHEQEGTFDFLKEAFAKHGTLDGKEVWSFAPSTITVYQGDTVNVTFTNPGDDPHTFTIPQLNVDAQIKENSETKTSFFAPKPGIYTFSCTVAEHAPYMYGTLVVLPASASS